MTLEYLTVDANSYSMGPPWWPSGEESVPPLQGARFDPSPGTEIPHAAGHGQKKIFFLKGENNKVTLTPHQSYFFHIFIKNCYD